ncbi:MAG: hypothetical protein ACXVB9_21815 [Bdellovibrionota bacterium]
MKKLNLFLTLIALTGLTAKADDAQVISTLSTAKISLIDGIRQAEKSSGPVTSAKFEIGDDGKLSLSIYTAPQGLRTPAEDNQLSELSGDPTAAPFAPAAEVFKDKEHIARASVHLTLMQLSKLSLVQIIQVAQRAVDSDDVPYSVANPQVRNGLPVADVFFADDGQSRKVTVNMLTGQVLR